MRYRSVLRWLRISRIPVSSCTWVMSMRTTSGRGRPARGSILSRSISHTGSASTGPAISKGTDGGLPLLQ